MRFKSRRARADIPRCAVCLAGLESNLFPSVFAHRFAVADRANVLRTHE